MLRLFMAGPDINSGNALGDGKPQLEWSMRSVVDQRVTICELSSVRPEIQNRYLPCLLLIHPTCAHICMSRAYVETSDGCLGAA